VTLGMLAAAGAAPLLPAISTLGAVLAFALAFALSVMWFQILRGPLVRLAKVGILHVHPFGWLNAVVSNVDHWINATVAGTERAVTWSLHALMLCIATGAKLTEDAARATWQGQDWLRRHTARHAGAQTGQSIDPRLKKLEQEFRGIEAQLAQLEKAAHAQGAVGAAAPTINLAHLQHGIDRLAKQVGQLAHEVDAVEHAQAHAGAKAKPGTQAIPRTKPRAVPRTKPATRHWSDILTKLGATALVVAALGRMGLGWLRCPSLLRMGKRIGCGGFGWLEGFFATAFEAMVVLDLCKFALAAQRLARLIVPQLAGTLLVQNAVCLGGGASYPSAHDSPKTLTTITLPSAHD
jgi:hypothetical protein